MNRRQMIQVAASTAVAHGVVTVLGCQAEQKSKPASSGDGATGHEHHHAEAGKTPASPVTPELSRLADAAAACIRAGETCLEHCLRSLGTGDTMLARCARLVEEMLPLCRATSSLAAMGSERARAIAKLCADACADCAAECEKHADHHSECKACLEACRATEAAARALG